jgi:hypothetical protein
MDNEKLSLILNKLLEKTEKGELEWERTAARNTLLNVLGRGTIALSHNIPEKASFGEILEGGSYKIDIRDEHGQIADSVEILKSNEYAGEFEKTAKIFQLARKQVDKTVDRILEELAA